MMPPLGRDPRTEAGKRRDGSPARRRLPGVAYALVAGSTFSAVVVLVAVGLVLGQGRSDAWDNASRSAENLLAVVVNDVRRNVQIYDQSLRGVIEGLSSPQVALLPPDLRRLVLFDRSAAAAYLGVVVVLDAKGDIVEESGVGPARSGNFADRAYFRVHADNPDLGLYISAPYFSRLRGGQPSIAFSRRIDRPDGSFGGVVVGAMQLAYFRDLFSQLDVGKDSFVVLLRDDGTVLMRRSAADGDESIGRDLSKSPNVQRILAEGSGAFTGKAAIDGVERLNVFDRIPGTPLIVDVVLSSDEILRDWRRRALILGGLSLVICLALITLSVLLSREFRRRFAAEDGLTELSVTDPLTGLANRRRFDEVIGREWRRTARTGSSLGLLMIDADRFKALNDRFGHAHGDEVLRRIARVIESALRRPGDLGVRYGGEEFAAVLPDIDVLGAMRVAETIRSRLETDDEGSTGGSAEMTVSIGVAWMRPTTESSAEELITAADEALYRAKRAGRNRVILASSAS